MAQLAVAIGGAAIGGAIGGPVGAQVGWAIGSTAGALLFGPKVPNTHGPRLDDLRVSTNTEGADMPMLWGRVRVAGQMLFAGDLVERKEKEEQGKGGGGGAYISYTYSATFALSFGECFPGAKLRKLWANKKLVYDKSADGDAVTAGYAITFYDGTQTVPDPLLEAIAGAGNVPAYTGQAILVCDDWDLTAEFGNRPPVIEAEIVTNGSESSDSSTYQVGNSSSGNGWMQYNPYNQRIYASFAGNSGKNAHIVEIDPFSKTILDVRNYSNEGTFNIMLCGKPYFVGTGEDIALFRQYTSGNDYFEVYDISQDWLQVYSWNTSGYALTPLAESESLIFFAYVSGFTYTLQKWDKTLGTQSTVSMPSGHEPKGVMPTWYNDTGSAGTFTNKFVSALKRTSDNKIVWGVWDSGADSWDVTSVSAIYTDSNSTFFSRPIHIDDYLYWPVNDTSGTPIAVLVRTDTDGVYVDTIDLDAAGATEAFNAGSGEPVLWHSAETNSLFWLTNARIAQYNYVTGALQEYTSKSGGSWCYYHAPTDTAWSGTFTGGDYVEIYAHRLGIIDPNVIAVSDILDDLCDMVDIGSTLRDWSNVTATVGGFAHTRQTSCRADCEPLLQYALADGVSTDWKVQGVELGGSSVATLVEGETVQGNRLEHVKPHDISIPSLCELQYMSSDSDMQSAMATAEWYTAPGEQVYQLSFSMTMADDTASELAQVTLQLAHDTELYKFSLPPAQIALEPADPITLWDGTRVRLTSVTRGHNGIIECEAISDNPLDLVADNVAGGSGLDVQTILSSSPPQLILIDSPLIRDVDQDHPGPYLTAFTYGAGFPNVSFQYSSDGSAFAGVGSISTEPNMGTCATVPSTVDWEDWDTTNTLRVTLLTGGTLATATTAEVLAGGNAAAWGKPGRWEIVQFKTVSLVSAGVYDLDDLLRGRRGTDPYIDSHVADDWFVILDSTSMVRQVLPNADIGAAKVYKAPKAGQAISDAIATTWTVNDEPLTPYTPITPTSSYSSPNLTLGWTRRTRKGGAYGGANTLTDNVGGPISEDSEAYSIQTLNGTGTVLNTYTSTTNSKTITDTNLTADYGAVPPTVYWRVAQTSAVVGAGHYMPTQTHYIIYPAELTIASLNPDAFWKLDETSGIEMTDSSGNAEHGTYRNTPSLNQSALTTLGSSVFFEAANSEDASVPVIINGGESAFSIVMFIRPNSLAGGDKQTYFSKGGRIEIYQSTGNKLVCYMEHAGTGSTTLTSTTNMSTSATMAVAVTFGDESGSNWLRLWIDGSNEDSANVGSETMSSIATWSTVGSLNTSFYGDAKIDCIALWNNATLTSSNISDIAAAAV